MRWLQSLNAGPEQTLKIVLLIVAALWWGAPAIVALGVFALLASAEARYYADLLRRFRVRRGEREEDRIREETLVRWQHDRNW